MTDTNIGVLCERLKNLVDRLERWERGELPTCMEHKARLDAVELILTDTKNDRQWFRRIIFAQILIPLLFLGVGLLISKI